MTQRIFDVDNPQEIFDLFPDNVERIKKSAVGGCWLCCRNSDETEYNYVPLKINWRDKTEITRPVDKSKWIGCLCWFADDAGDEYIGVLHAICNGDDSYPYICKNKLLRVFKDCRPVRRDEVQFADDAESKE